MAYFVRFLGWLILYSFLYFLILDVMGVGPGKDGPVISSIILFLSIPLWWFSWKKFDSAFGPQGPHGGCSSIG